MHHRRRHASHPDGAHRRALSAPLRTRAGRSATHTAAGAAGSTSSAAVRATADLLPPQTRGPRPTPRAPCQPAGRCARAVVRQAISNARDAARGPDEHRLLGLLVEVLPADLHLLAHQLLVKGRCARLAAHAVEILHSVGDASGDAPLRRGSRHGGELLGGEGGLLLHLNGVGVRRAQLAQVAFYLLRQRRFRRKLLEAPQRDLLGENLLDPWARGAGQWTAGGGIPGNDLGQGFTSPSTFTLVLGVSGASDRCRRRCRRQLSEHAEYVRRLGPVSGTVRS